jgi:hypothetical protein
MIKMDSKENFKDFNYRFISLINKIPSTSKHANDVSIEFYDSSLLVSMAMFVMRDEKATLEDTFKESIKVEKDTLSLKGNHGSEHEKDNPTKKKFLLFKPSIEKKDQYVMDMESLQRILKKISNEILT